MGRVGQAFRRIMETLSGFYVVRGFPGPGNASWERWLHRKADPLYAHQLSDMNLLKVKKVEGIVLSIREHAEETGKPLAGTTVLDAGCGYGAYSCVLAGLGCRVTGIDMNPEMIQTAIRRAEGFGIPGIRLEVEDSLKYLERVPEASFDVILALDTMEHLEDPGTFLRFAHRTLPPSGTLLVIIPNGISSVELIYHPLADWIHTSILGEAYPPGAIHTHRFSLQTILRMLDDAGFTVRGLSNTYASGIFGLLFLIGGFRGRCADTNLRIADHLPAWMAGGWLIRAEKEAG